MCKQIHQELRPTCYAACEAIITPDLNILNVCASNRFIIDISGAYFIELLEDLRPLRCTIRSVVYCLSYTRYFDVDVQVIWFNDGDDGWNDSCCSVLQLPASEEIAIVIPRNRHWFIGVALKEVCDILEMGGLQRLHLLYEDPNEELERFLF